MSTISYTPLEDGTPVTANVFNERFAQIINVINGGLSSDNFSSGGIPVGAISDDVFKKMYPVGSIYVNATDDTNPGTLLGFGTWVAFGAGRVMVGYNSSETEFNAAQKTGGEKRHALTAAENASHTHSIDPPATSTNSTGGHTHNTHVPYTVKSGAGARVTGAVNDARGGATTSAGAHSHSVNIAAFNSAPSGSGAAHNNLQPYITVYAWKRTA